MDRINIIRGLAALLGLAGIPLAACNNDDEASERRRSGDFIEERRVGDYDASNSDVGARSAGYDNVGELAQQHPPAAPVTGMSGQVPTNVSPATSTGVGPTTTGVAPMTLSATEIEIEPSLASLCDLPESRTLFESNTATLTGEGHVLLDQVANCMTMGGLLGQSIDLVNFGGGGDVGIYTRGLPADRASVVREYFVQKGIDGNRILTSSEGGTGAMVSDRGMMQDNRVVIRLGNPQEAEATAGLEADEY